MGTTANNGWPYPESTDFVADGATAIENLADAIDGAVGLVCSLSRTTGDLWPTGTGSYVNFGAADVVFDGPGWHDPSGNPSRITPTVEGYYLFTFGGQWFTTASGNYQVSLAKNGSSLHDMIQTSAYYPSMLGSGIRYMNGTTDYVQLLVYHDAGTTKQFRWAQLGAVLIKEA
jgi:hypothetical protein